MHALTSEVMQQIYEHDVPVETILLCTYKT